MEPKAEPPRRPSLGLYVFGMLLLGAAGAGAFYYVRIGTISVASARDAMASEASRGPRVVVANAMQGPKTREIVLLGDARPFVTATLFAKISGYLKSVTVDKGDAVAAGQVVATIDSAELDSQYQSAVADLDYKQRLAVRARELLRTGNVAQQAAELAESNLRMAQETVRNLDTMRSYQVLKAPFAGTVVGRFADPGALMQAATTNQASSLPVVQVSDNSRLRIGIYVEQRDVAAVHIGDEAVVSDASNPERTRTAKISRTAGTLDPRTRTLFMEIDVDNSDGFLVAGSFVYVTLHVPVASFPQIPVTALLQRGGASLVAGVGADDVVRFRPVRVASTDGIVVNVADGVRAGDKVALNVPDEVTEGGKIRPVASGR